MTENEAIKKFNKMVGDRMSSKNGISEEQHELFQIAMDALEEIQQYREIGTVEECQKWKVRARLVECFPQSYINSEGEFIAHEKTNQYFILKSYNTVLDIKCKVLEWLSRAACKEIFCNGNKVSINKFMLDGINRFLETKFTVEDMEQIYTYIGNACNHQKTVSFVESGYNMAVLEEK